MTTCLAALDDYEALVRRMTIGFNAFMKGRRAQPVLIRVAPDVYDAFDSQAHKASPLASPITCVTGTLERDHSLPVGEYRFELKEA